MKQADDKVLQEWARHWPFKRASAALIRRAQQHVRQQRKAPPNAPRALL